jgi:hypothetical protein
METLKIVVTVLCAVIGVADMAIAVYQAKHQRFDRAAYWASFGACMLILSRIP